MRNPTHYLYNTPSFKKQLNELTRHGSFAQVYAIIKAEECELLNIIGSVWWFHKIGLEWKDAPSLLRCV